MDHASLRLSGDLPIIVELVASEEKIKTLLPHIDGMATERLATLEKVRVIKYVANKAGAVDGTIGTLVQARADCLRSSERAPMILSSPDPWSAR